MHENKQKFYIYDINTHFSPYSDFVRGRGEWWYKINRRDSDIKGVRLYNFDLEGVNVTILKDSSNNSYDILYNSSNEIDTKVDLQRHQSVYVLAKNLGKNSTKGIRFEAQTYHTGAFSPGVIAAIVVVSIIVLIIIGWFIKKWNKHRKREYYRNAGHPTLTVKRIDDSNMPATNIAQSSLSPEESGHSDDRDTSPLLEKGSESSNYNSNVLPKSIEEGVSN